MLKVFFFSLSKSAYEVFEKKQSQTRYGHKSLQRGLQDACSLFLSLYLSV